MNKIPSSKDAIPQELSLRNLIMQLGTKRVSLDKSKHQLPLQL
jgi:hypothetical protein